MDIELTHAIQLLNTGIQMVLATFLIFILAKEKIEWGQKFKHSLIINACLGIIGSILVLLSKELFIVKTALTFAGFFLILRYILKKNSIPSFLISLNIFILYTVVEMILVSLIMLITGDTFENLLVSNDLMYVGMSIGYTMLILPIAYAFTYFASKNLDAIILQKTNRESIRYLSIILCLICPQVFLLVYIEYEINLYFVLTNIVQVILLLLTSAHRRKLTATQTKLALELENEKIYNRTLSATLDTVRGVKHDLNNIMQSLQGYVESENLNGIKKFFTRGAVDEAYKIKYLEQLSPDKLTDPGLYNLIASKFFYCESKGILLKIDITTVLGTDDFHNCIYEASRALGILLDNAIEATENLDTPNDPKTILLNIEKVPFTDQKAIIIENRFKEDENVTVDNCFKKDFSTKKVKSGFGLFEVDKTINKFPSLNLFTSIIGDRFNQKLIIKPVEELSLEEEITQLV
ncbi:MAG: GHKL domain-containing protein [Clostridia bacterium]